MLGAVRFAMHPPHRRTDHLADRKRFAGEHRRLIGNTHALEMHVGVKVRARRVGVLGQERRAVAMPLDVGDYIFGFCHIPHHEIGAAGILLHLRRRRARLLVVVLAVDQRGQTVARVRIHTLPDVEHRAAGRVHHHAPLGAERLEVVDRDAEGG